MRRLFILVVFWGPMPLVYIDPYYGVILYTLINIIRPEQLMWGDASAAGRVFLAAQFVSFTSWFINKDKLMPEYTPTPFQIKILILLAIEMTIVTHTVAANPDWSWRWTSGFIKMIVFCFVISKVINTARKLELYYAISVLWFALLQIWGIQQKLGGNARMEGLGGNVLPDVNCLASVAVMYMPMAYYTVFSTKKWIRNFIGIPSIIISIIFIMFGGSRGAFLGMSFCMLYIFGISKGTQKLKMLLSLTFIGLLLIGVLSKLAPPGFFDEYTERLATILGKEDESGEVTHEASAAGRTAMWKGAWYIYSNHSEYWLLGVGMNSYSMIYYPRHINELALVLDPDELAYVVFTGHGGKEVHNTYLNVLLGGGAVVFLTWMFLIFYGWYQAHRIPKKYPRFVDGVDIHNYARAVEVGIVGYCLCITFVNLEFADFFYWYLTMAGVIANLGKAKLAREAAGIEDEEFEEEFMVTPAYAHF